MIGPAIAKMYPSLTNQFMIVLMGSSIDRKYRPRLNFAGNFIQSRNFRSFEVYLVIVRIYLLPALGFRAVFAWLGRHAFRHFR